MRTVAARAFSRDAVGIVISGNFLLVVYHGLIVALFTPESAARLDRGHAGSKTAWLFVSRRRVPCALPPRFWFCAWVTGARAEEASTPTSEQQPAATPSPSPSGQKGGAGRRHRRAAAARAEQHRLPPDSTTRQTLALPGRTLDFTATAGSIRLFDDKGEPQADIAYTSYQLDGADRAQPAGDVSVQRRAGRVLGLAAVRRRRPVAAVDRRRRRGVFRLARTVAQRRDLARLHRSRLHRSRRHRLQPLRRVRRGRAQAVLFGRRRRQRRSRW